MPELPVDVCLQVVVRRKPGGGTPAGSRAALTTALISLLVLVAVVSWLADGSFS